MSNPVWAILKNGAVFRTFTSRIAMGAFFARASKRTSGLTCTVLW